MRRYRRKKSNIGKTLILLILAGIIGGLVYLYNSVMFEQKKPTLKVADTLYWNFKSPIPISVSDESGIKFIRVTLSDGENNVVLANESFMDVKKKVDIEAKYPRTAFFDKKSKLTLNVEVADNSMWNFFMGNEIKKSIPIKIDTKKPSLNILTNSYSIVKGGVGSVIFSAKDDNLDKLYIKTSSGSILKPTPFYKDGYYISLIPWPHKQSDFTAYVVAVDKAGNESKDKVRFYLLAKNYRTSGIQATDKFINGKISELAEEYAPNNGEKMNNLDKFRFINETLRKENEALIHSITKKVSDEMITNFTLKPFYPLKNSAAVASFGDHRFYRYNGEKVSESYHLGLDLASTARADIKSSNDGVVVFAKDNGIYGKNIIISHGLGVYTLYGHCSSFAVSVGDKVKRGDIIATTGLTGLALGDHLHFGVLVQGVEVRPEEWMDKKWFADNIEMMIKDAKKLIDRK